MVEAVNMILDFKVVIGVIIFVIATYLLLKLMNKKPVSKQYKKELEEILTKEEYRVKGRHE